MSGKFTVYQTTDMMVGNNGGGGGGVDLRRTNNMKSGAIFDNTIPSIHDVSAISFLPHDLPEY